MQGCADVQGSTCTIIFAFQNRHVSLVKEPYFHGALWQKRPGLQSHHDPKFSLSMYFCKKALHFCKRALHSRKRALHLRKSINQSHHQPIISLSICFRKRALHLRKRVLHLRTRARWLHFVRWPYFHGALFNKFMGLFLRRALGFWRPSRAHDSTQPHTATHTHTATDCNTTHCNTTHSTHTHTATDCNTTHSIV